MTDKEKYIPTYICLSCGNFFDGYPIIISKGHAFGVPRYASHVCENGEEHVGELCEPNQGEIKYMTDKDIGKTAREIVERGNTAEVKRNKDGIVILEVGKKIVKSDKER